MGARRFHVAKEAPGESKFQVVVGLAKRATAAGWKSLLGLVFTDCSSYP